MSDTDGRRPRKPPAPAVLHFYPSPAAVAMFKAKHGPAWRKPATQELSRILEDWVGDRLLGVPIEPEDVAVFQREMPSGAKPETWRAFAEAMLEALVGDWLEARQNKHQAEDLARYPKEALQRALRRITEKAVTGGDPETDPTDQDQGVLATIRARTREATLDEDLIGPLLAESGDEDENLSAGLSGHVGWEAARGRGAKSEKP